MLPRPVVLVALVAAAAAAAGAADTADTVHADESGPAWAQMTSGEYVDSVLATGTSGARPPAGLRVDACTVPRIPAGELSESVFREYVRAGTPLIVQGGVPERWASARYTFASVEEQFGHIVVDVPGVDEEKLSLADLIELIAYTELVDAGEVQDQERDRHNEGGADMVNMKRREAASTIDSEALMQMRGATRRGPDLLADNDVMVRLSRLLVRINYSQAFSPSYFIMGAGGSGVNLHFDTLRTSFWNALVHGGPKHWVLYGAELTEAVGSDKIRHWNDEVSHRDFFETADVYTLSDEELAARYPGLRRWECMQEVGDIMWVPAGGLFHATFAMAPDIAVSTNTVLVDEIDHVFDDLCYTGSQPEKDVGAIHILDESEGPVMAVYFCSALATVAPALYESSCCASAEFEEFLRREMLSAWGYSRLDHVGNVEMYHALRDKMKKFGSANPLKPLRRRRGEDGEETKDEPDAENAHDEL